MGEKDQNYQKLFFRKFWKISIFPIESLLPYTFSSNFECEAGLVPDTELI